MTPDRLTRLFVYGTLRRDPSHRMFHLLARHGRYVGDATVAGRLFDLGSYPGMFLADQGRVVGELYDIDQASWDEVIERLDEYEGCSSNDPQPHEYRREVVDSQLTNGTRLPAWAYVLAAPPPQASEIRSGDYLAWREHV